VDEKQRYQVQIVGESQTLGLREACLILDDKPLGDAYFYEQAMSNNFACQILR